MKSIIIIFVAFLMAAPFARARQDWVVYEGKAGPGKGKHIVLISGDEEYRSEEALPQLGKILATHHGFKCTVVFSIDEKTGMVNPNNRHNIPGLEALKGADLMVIATRFRDLKDEQMQLIDDYLKLGRPVIGMRTATHAFNVGGNKKFAHYGNGYRGPKKEWQGGFGRLVLGDHWLSHHGGHKNESTVGFIAPGAGKHPTTRGIKNGDVWGPTDVYGVRLPLPKGAQHIILGQVTKRTGPRTNDPFFGMKPTDDEAVAGRKNNPMMPVFWTKSYQVPGGKKGRVFTTTMGSSTDLVSDGTRRMLVNGAYWLVDLEIPKGGTKVDIVGKFNPTQYSFKRGNHWPKQDIKPANFNLK
jgi:hypothetical protein